jgi:hypothetical protein
MKVIEMDDVKLLETTFAGGRPTASGKHRRWDTFFIRVQPAN